MVFFTTALTLTWPPGVDRDDAALPVRPAQAVPQMVGFQPGRNLQAIQQPRQTGTPWCPRARPGGRSRQPGQRRTRQRAVCSGQHALAHASGGLRAGQRARGQRQAPNGATTAISCGPWEPTPVVTNSTMLSTMATARTWSTRAARAKNRQATSSSASPTRARLVIWSSAA